MTGIKKIRQDKGLTQDAFAKAVGVDRSTVSRWESGNMLPRFSRLKDIAKLLNVSIEELIKDCA